MTIKDLTEFLKHQQADNSRAEFDVDGIKKEWLAAIDKLFSTIETWLKPARDEKVLDIKRSKITLNEERFGTYSAPALEITSRSPGRIVTVHPIARMTFGGAGRVDIGHGPNSRTLLRTDPTRKTVTSAEEPPRAKGSLKWMISSPDPRDKGIEFTEETLSEALQSLFS